MECLTGSLAGLPVSHKTSQLSPSGNRYLVAWFDTESGGKVKVAGEMNTPAPGWSYRLYGEWEETAKYGRTFKFSRFEPIIDRSPDGVADYLARHLPTIGRVWASRIVEHFGDDTLHVLQADPKRLSEVPGLTPRMVYKIREFLESAAGKAVDPVAYAELTNMLKPVRPPRRIIDELLEEFGSNAPQFVRENPYALMAYPGMGWDRVDRLAIDHLGYDRGGVDRHEQAAMEALARGAEAGHTKLEHHELYCDASTLLNMAISHDAVARLLSRREIIRTEADGRSYYSAVSLYQAEETIARRIAELQAAATPIGHEWSYDWLEPDQAEITGLIDSHGVCILAGVPGSGKSWTTAVVIQELIRAGVGDILVAAPTGKAAKQDAEFLDHFNPDIKVPCMTLHRALGIGRGSPAPEGISKDRAKVNRGRDGSQFLHDRGNPLPYSVVVIDEASMGDVRIMAAVLEAVPDGSRVLIVGDPYQLPSVGPGAVLRDLIAAGVPSVILDQPRRNSGEIAQACYEIKNGRVPRPGGGNWVHRESKDEIGILKFIRQLHINYVEKFGAARTKDELQVISPTHKDILGCRALNEMIAAVVNPQPEGSPCYRLGPAEDAYRLRVGDKVVRTKNGRVKLLVPRRWDLERDLVPVFGAEEAPAVAAELDGADVVGFGGLDYLTTECYVVNGDLGELADINGYGPFARLFVRFRLPDRLCMLVGSEAEIEPAYSLTVHKMQGSSAKRVVIPLSDYYYNHKTRSGLWVRELVYTAFSRPTDQLITVGPISCLKDAVGRVTIDRRQTLLGQFAADAALGVPA